MKDKIKVHKCKQCGCEISPFYDFKNYAYKVDGKIFCSYSCMQNYKKLHKRGLKNYATGLRRV